MSNNSTLQTVLPQLQLSNIGRLLSLHLLALLYIDNYTLPQPVNEEYNIKMQTTQNVFKFFLSEMISH